MRTEKGELALVSGQFVALVAVVLVLSTFTPGQSVQSNPVMNSVYWGTSGQGEALRYGQLTLVGHNESVITAYFTVAFSTKVSDVYGSRLCLGPNSTVGQSTTYIDI